MQGSERQNSFRCHRARAVRYWSFHIIMCNEVWRSMSNTKEWQNRDHCMTHLPGAPPAESVLGSFAHYDVQHLSNYVVWTPPCGAGADSKVTVCRDMTADCREMFLCFAPSRPHCGCFCHWGNLMRFVSRANLVTDCKCQDYYVGKSHNNVDASNSCFWVRMPFMWAVEHKC